ncbi:MAG: phospholipid carrier-dependent glycosyltransferase [Chitinivibrionales bacterium]
MKMFFSRLVNTFKRWCVLDSAGYACVAAVLVVAVAAAVVPAFRYALLYNFVPLFFIGFAVTVYYRSATHGSPQWTLMLLTGLSLCFHGYNLISFGVAPEFDSKEYLSLAHSFASGHGLAGMMYRPPLYPALVGLSMIAGDANGLIIVILQHILLIACVPGIFWLGRLFGFSREACLIASMFIALNSLLMQSAEFVMTEIVFLVLTLGCVAGLKRLYEAPSNGKAIVAGLLFAAASYCRELLFPILLFGCAALAWKKGRRGIFAGLLSIVVFFGATAPWSVRNLFLSEHYSMSASFGVQAFTKVMTFHLENPAGRYFKCLETPLSNVLKDMGRSQYSVPKVPEDDWQINRIPHTLTDTLERYHGFSFFAASDLLGKAALEGFYSHPAGYLSSILKSFGALLFSHREIYPDAGAIVPVSHISAPLVLIRAVKGMVYVSGYVFLLFPIAVAIRQRASLSIWAPFALVCMMYFFTAAIQIGLTRYTIPWEPFKILCVAYTVETAVVAAKTVLRRWMARARFP